MDLSLFLQQDHPYLYSFLTWIISIVILYFKYSPAVILDMLTPTMMIGSVVISIFINVWSVMFAKRSKWFKKMKTRFSFFDQPQKPLTAYQQMIKENTEMQLLKLTQSQQFKDYMKKKRDFQQQGRTCEPMMCTPETSYDLKQQMRFLQKMERVIYNDENYIERQLKKNTFLRA